MKRIAEAFPVHTPDPTRSEEKVMAAPVPIPEGCERFSADPPSRYGTILHACQAGGRRLPRVAEMGQGGALGVKDEIRV